MIMKRLVTLIMIISCAGFCLAQDIIALKNGERIENVTVSNVTDTIISYIADGDEIVLQNDSINAILYADGRYVEITTTNAKADALNTSPFTEAMIEEHPFLQYYEIDNKGRVRLKAAFLDKSYSKECRKIGQNIYDKEFKALFQPAYKKAKKSGLSFIKAQQLALDEVLPIIIEDSDKAVRECAGETK